MYPERLGVCHGTRAYRIDDRILFLRRPDRARLPLSSVVGAHRSANHMIPAFHRPHRPHRTRNLHFATHTTASQLPPAPSSIPPSSLHLSPRRTRNNKSLASSNPGQHFKTWTSSPLQRHRHRHLAPHFPRYLSLSLALYLALSPPLSTLNTRHLLHGSPKRRHRHAPRDHQSTRNHGMEGRIQSLTEEKGQRKLRSPN